MTYQIEPYVLDSSQGPVPRFVPFARAELKETMQHLHFSKEVRKSVCN